MSTQDESLRPEDFAEAAKAVIADALTKDFGEKASVLAESGLFGVCAAANQGGLELGLEYAVPITEVAGSLQLQFPLVEQIVLAKALGDTEIAAALISGEKVATIAWQKQNSQMNVYQAHYVEASDWILVPNGNGMSLVETASIKVEKDSALDPDYPQYDVYVESPVVLATLSAQTSELLVKDAKKLFAGFINGLSAEALQRTVDYTSTRVQFGRPLSAKQVVRHTLARMQLLLATSTASLSRVLKTDEFGQERDISTTLANSIHNAVFILEKAIHLHGGMGFTWEVPLHYSLRQVRKLEAAFDNGQNLENIAQQFISKS